MFSLLEKYALTGKAIMNLYAGDPDTLRAIKKYIPEPVACDTKHDYDIFSEEMIDASKEAGYSIICLCHFSPSPVTKELVEYARSKEMCIWEWGMTTEAEGKLYLDIGVSGFQMYTREVTNSVIRGMGY